MTVLFVHGVPDTPQLWDPLIAMLGPGEFRAVSLPGFGGPPPADFDCHMDSYAGWLISQIEALDGPVHIVGHDWGGLLTLRVAHLRPDLMTSWAVLNAALFPGLKWHRLARVWQTPWRGELAMMLLRGNRARTLLGRAGMPDALIAAELPFIDTHMKRSILRLYRSATDIGKDWGRDMSGLPARGLVIATQADPYVPQHICKTLSEAAQVPLAVHPGGHWAVFDQPAPFSVTLQAHWAQ